MSRYLKLFLLIVLAVGLFWGIQQTKANDGQKTNNVKYNAKKDKIVFPTSGKIQNDLTLAGSISASDIANVRFQTSGKLAWVGVRVGDRVKKYQGLASLDKTELRKDLDKELNDYKAALHTFNDTQDTYKTTKEKYLVTDTIQRVLDRSQYTLNNQVIDYELSELTLKLATIYSPIAGVVTAIDQPLAGVNITPATATFTVIDPKSIYLRSEIDQEDVTKVKLGQIATIKLDSFPDLNIKSEITHIAFTPISGESSTVYEIRFKLPLDNQDLDYRLGMDGDALITLEESDNNTLSIPLEAIYQDDNQSYVWLKKDNQLVKQTVTTGIENDNAVEVTTGLTLNDQIVIRSQ